MQKITTASLPGFFSSNMQEIIPTIRKNRIDAIAIIAVVIKTSFVTVRNQVPHSTQSVNRGHMIAGPGGINKLVSRT